MKLFKMVFKKSETKKVKQEGDVNKRMEDNLLELTRLARAGQEQTNKIG